MNSNPLGVRQILKSERRDCDWLSLSQEREVEIPDCCKGRTNGWRKTTTFLRLVALEGTGALKVFFPTPLALAALFKVNTFVLQMFLAGDVAAWSGLAKHSRAREPPPIGHPWLDAEIFFVEWKLRLTFAVQG